MTATVVTACFGGYDRLLRQREQDIPVVWVAITDEPVDAPPPWHVEVVGHSDEHPRMAAKPYKLTPTDGDDVVWIDANMEVRSSSFVREALAARRDGIAVWRHPHRKCIYDEAEASLRLAPEKYGDQPIMEQVAHYRAEGHPERAGLYACGTVAWDLSDPVALALGQAWLDECRRWSYQDQLSLPVVARRMGVVPGVFPVRQLERGLSNRWLTIHPHLVAA